MTKEIGAFGIGRPTRVQKDGLVGLEEGVGEFGPRVERGAVFTHREAAGRAVVHAAVFHAGHSGGALGLALLLARFLGAGHGGRHGQIEGEARGIGFHVADPDGDLLLRRAGAGKWRGRVK